MKIIIIGGGVVGCGAALELADRGAEVLLFERGELGAEASSAAAGILGAQVELKEPSPLLKRFVRARALMREWASELEQRTGDDVGYRASGVLRVARDSADFTAIQRQAAWQRAEGVRSDVLGAAEARRLAPAISGGLHGAVWFEDDAQVDPRKLMRALISAVSRINIEVRRDCEVTGVLTESGRCIGVEFKQPGPNRGVAYADAVVVAGGSWSSRLAGLPCDWPQVEPIRGQMLELECETPSDSGSPIVYNCDGYVVPRGTGRVVCGSTMESVGFSREVTPNAIESIRKNAITLVPALSRARTVATWSNFRPFCGPGGPVIGVSSVPRLYLAAGHHRNGILLARHTALAIADAVLTNRPDILPYAPLRS